MTTWNSGDKSSNVTLSGGSLIATTTSGSYGGVRATSSVSSGKYYYECAFLVSPTTIVGIGWANSSAVFTNFIGVDKNGVADYPQQGLGYFNSVSFSTEAEAVQYMTVGVAFDIGNLKIWFRVNNGLWNNSSTDDPSSNTGGASVSTINAGPYFPVFIAQSSGASVQANFGATDFNYAVPSGFSVLDSNTQNYSASSKFIGYTELAPPNNGASSSKFLGYTELAPPSNAVSASKFLGYAILTPSTATGIFNMGYVYG